MRKRILIVDDEPDITAMVRIALEATTRFNVLEVNDPREALSSARSFEPDLVLMDIMMPEIDGSAVAASFLGDKQLQHIPIVFLTALVNRKEVCVDHGWFETGGRTFFPKTGDFQGLIQCIEDQLHAEHLSKAV